jgi:hypothetical protein
MCDPAVEAWRMTFDLSAAYPNQKRNLLWLRFRISDPVKCVSNPTMSSWSLRPSSPERKL